MEYRSCGLPWTDWHWVRSIFFRMNHKIMIYFSAVVVFRTNGEQEHGKETICRYMALSYSRQTSDNLLCDFWAKVWVNERPCNPQVRLRVKQHILLGLLNCRTSIFSLRHNSMTSVLLRISSSFAMSSVLHTSSDRSSKVLFSCAEKCLNLPSSMFFNVKLKATFIFSARIKLLKKRSNVSSNFCVEVRHSINEDFVSRTFKFRNYKEKLPWVQVPFKIRVINFVDDIVSINFWCPDRWAMLGVFMLT